jgi:tight adherence protein C
MIVPLLAGAGLGLAAFTLWRASSTPPRPLAVALESLNRPRSSIALIDTPGAESGRRVVRRIGSALVPLAEGTGLDLEGLRASLRITERPLEQHLFEKLLLAAYGVALPIVALLVTAAAGVALPLPAVLVGSVTLAAGGFVMPELTLRSAVERRRRDFRHALSSYLDLVGVILAGGGGTETALYDAAEAGDGWAYRQLRAALGACRLAGTTPWEAFADLGAELGVTELVELAATIGLAGEHGARVRGSLAAKAESLRTHELAEAETEAQAASERMALPLVMLLFGFVGFIGYPAIDRVITSL